MPKTKIKNHSNTYIIRSVHKLSSQIYLRKKNIRNSTDTISVHLLREKFYKILLRTWYMPCMRICQCVTHQHIRHERRRRLSARRALSKWNRTYSSQLCRLTWTVSRVLTFAFDIFITHIWKPRTCLGRKISHLLKLSVPNTYRRFGSSPWKVFAW
jgi:hypothetical protein